MQILVIYEYLNGRQIRNTAMVNETGYIPVAESIDTIRFSVLQKKETDQRLVFSDVRTSVPTGTEYSRIFTLLSRSNKYESSSRVSASVSEMISPMYLR